MTLFNARLDISVTRNGETRTRPVERVVQGEDATEAGNRAIKAEQARYHKAVTERVVDEYESLEIVLLSILPTDRA